MNEIVLFLLSFLGDIILLLLSFLAGMSAGFSIAYSSSQKVLRQLMHESEQFPEKYLNELKEIDNQKQTSNE